MHTSMNIWKRKLLAFLHDPPHKALDIQSHENERDTFIRQAGFDHAAAMAWFDKSADWMAAASDRFPFPRYADSGLKSEFGGSSHPFKHPLGGSDLVFDSKDVGITKMAETLQKVQHYAQNLASIPEEKRDWANFFLHWRRWPVDSAQSDGGWPLPFMPADTRIPDHPIWHHNSIASALQGCRNESTGALEPAFLLFQLGPVQEFIMQARSTRDLWSGSYLLSWLMAHAIKAVTDEIGPDHIVYPFLRAQPLFDLLHRESLYEKVPYAGPDGREDTLWGRLKNHEREMLVPNLPNRFLAIVPAERTADLARAAEKVVAAELKRMADASWSWLHARQPMDDKWRTRFNAQIAAFPQIAWQVLPWGTDPDAEVKDFEAIEPEAAHHLKEIRKLDAWKNAGSVWSCLYAKIDRLLAARRNTRNTGAWKTDEDQQGTLKDSFSGKEEIVGDEDWWKALRRHPELKFHFRSDDRLGAINLVKRVWHKAYLEAKWKLKVRHAVAFESVPGIAAGTWKRKLKERLREGLKESAQTFDRLAVVCSVIQKHGAGKNIELPDVFDEKSIEEWLDAVDPEVFMPATWSGDGDGAVGGALRKLYDAKETGLAGPPGYVAILALDGDEMGKWVSGEKTPEVVRQFSMDASKHFEGKLKGVRRPLSPSYHLQFSEALANFAVYIARLVVEAFDGQLIYAGGDDVRAMVPATRALDCAEALRAAFQGSKRLVEFPELASRVEVLGSNGGFVRLTNPKGEQPRWPLIVPGPSAEVSIGVAIGHCSSPLQGLVRAAEEAERDAKSLHGRAALAVSLFKRSGEILKWGAKWESGALPLFRKFVELSAGEEPALPNRFGYALGERLAPYRPTSRSVMDVEGFPTLEIVGRELAHVLKRQGRALKEESASFDALCRAYLQSIPESRVFHDFPMLFHVANFVTRGERR